MPRYSEDMVYERSPFWYPTRRPAIPGTGTEEDPYVIPGSPTVVCPSPPPGSPSLVIWNSYQLHVHLLQKQLEKQLRMGSQQGSIN